jgi:hypothetical protein
MPRYKTVGSDCVRPCRASVAAFHEGRSSQTGIFAELKSGCQMDYVPVTNEVGNRLFYAATIVAHNLNRNL